MARTTADGPATGERAPLSGRLVILMAVAAGAIVANLYYAQPLLHQIGGTFHVGSAAASLIVTFTQAGYAAGLLLLVPLGDVRRRRPLVASLFALVGLGCLGCATAPSLWVFEVASLVTGALCVAAQVLVPYAAELADPAHRGRVVGRIMSGLLLGILLARTVAGLISSALGWRAMYLISAGVMAALTLVLYLSLPAESTRPQLAYRSLLASTLRMLATEPLLRRRAVHGACAFAAFSALWTSLAFLLSGPPFHYSNAVIGTFGLAGAGGVLAANLAGRSADSNRTVAATIVAGALLVGAFGLLALGRDNVAVLLAGIVVLDVGTQGMQITNQAIIYGRWAAERNRVNGAYMICFFLGGSLGSLGSGIAFAHAGWHGVCALGAIAGALSLGLSAYERLAATRAAGAAEPVASR